MATPPAHRLRFALVVLSCAFALTLAAAPAPLAFKPDLVVASDGSGDFKSVHDAVQSIPRVNRERRVIFIKDGVYQERVRVDAACISLRGESRAGTRIEFARANTAPRDNLGVAVLNLSATAHDFVLTRTVAKLEFAG